MAETPACHTCRLRGVSRPAVVRGWHRSRWRFEAACSGHAPALARAVPLAPAPAPPWSSAAPPQRPPAAPAALTLPARPPARPRPAAPAAGPPLCRTCLLRGISRPAVVRGWHRSRWRLEAACADHAPGLACALPLGAPAPALAVAAASAASLASAPAPERRPQPDRRRRPVLLAAGALTVAAGAAIVGVVAAGSSSQTASAPALPVAAGASVGPEAAARPHPVAPRSMRVPRLVGRPLSGARASLPGLRLIVARRAASGVPAGVVLSQRPLPGTRVRPGSALRLTVARPLAAIEASAVPAPPAAPQAPRASAAASPAPAGCAGGAGWSRAWGAYRCR
jgi:PASTA domain-containing protein